LASPTAKKAADRSSRRIQLCSPGVSASVSANGADLDPGEITACLTPWATTSAAKAAQASYTESAAIGLRGQIQSAKKSFKFCSGFSKFVLGFGTLDYPAPSEESESLVVKQS
tara:strand:- start:252 stop:590 length:339 start_codon:yes stop_codon:yes gene_type:complete